jgi:hypothetical protein
MLRIMVLASSLAGWKGEGSAFKGADLISSSEILEDHADGAGNRAFARHDEVACGCDHVAGRSGQGADIRDDGLGFGHLADGLEDAFAAIGGAAWRGNGDDEGLDLAALGNPIQPLEKLLVVGDHARNADLGDVRTRQAAGGSERDTVERETDGDEKQEGDDPPEAELTAQMPPLRDCLLIHTSLSS